MNAIRVGLTRNGGDSAHVPVRGCLAPPESGIMVFTTTSEFGGYHSVMAIHAEGSIEAEKVIVVRDYDTKSAIGYAGKMVGIDQSGAPAGRSMEKGRCDES